MIQKQPPRQQSLEHIDRLQAKLEELIATRESLKQKLELRRKQFHLLVQCVHQLQDMLQHEGSPEVEEEGEGEMEVC